MHRPSTSPRTLITTIQALGRPYSSHPKTLIFSVKTLRINSPQCVASITSASIIQLDDMVVSSYQHSKQMTQRARHWEMDKVMKRLGIEVIEIQGKDVKLVVHCNIDGKPIGGGGNN
jgi:hypothetical protein